MANAKTKTKKKINKKKFTIHNLLHNVCRFNVKSDVVIDGKVVKDHIVGWVDLRGGQDPVYLSRASKHQAIYQDAVRRLANDSDAEGDEKISEEETEELLQATRRFTSASIACAIEEWDEDFFGEKFTLDRAIEIFTQESFFVTYNQLALYAQESNDFLPNASQLR